MATAKKHAELPPAFLRDLGRSRVLTREEELEVGRALLEGSPQERSAARSRMIRSNLRLVVAIARRYEGRGLPLMDLVQEGNIGLVHAVEKYDIGFGTRFSTYAGWWIRQAMARAIESQGRAVRVPAQKAAVTRRIVSEQRRLEQVHGGPVPRARVAAQLDMSLEEADRFLTLRPDVSSLDAPAGADGDATVADFVPDDGSEDALDRLARHRLEEGARWAIDTLPEREARILQLRFGLLDGDPLSLRAIGERMGVSRERVRQLEARAFDRLRDAEEGRLRALI